MNKKNTLLIIIGLFILATIGLRLKTFFVQDQVTAMIKDQKIKVEVAATERARSLGLAGRLTLPPDTGMVFIFDKPERYNFWMRGMFFPIDIIWIKSGRVIDLAENLPAPALGQIDLPLYSPTEPVDTVLEVKAGFAKQHNIAIGDSFYLNY